MLDARVSRVTRIMAASNLFGITSGSTVLSSTLRLRPEGSGPPPKGSEERWNLAESAGRLVEISGSGAAASLTFAFGLVLEAQQQGELVGWVTVTESFFYPPDVAQGGVDLDALVVARVPDLRAVSRAGEKLLRSGAFGLVVLDVGAAEIPMPLQARLAGLARQHHAALVCLTEKEKRDFSLGSLVSLRVHAERTQLPQGRFTCKLKVLKDKRRGPTWSQAEVYRGPAGLC